MNRSALLEKYDVQVPRYTSYPTVPFWSDPPTTEEWLGSLRQAASDPALTWALYIHIPFCESLCTYCGCNNLITQDHRREGTYTALIHQEWQRYREAVPELFDRGLRQLHLGGGTPTFFSPESLEQLLSPILAEVRIRSEAFDASIEVDPRVTRTEHLRSLRKLGFSRISMGVQDFDAETQRLVNRIQPFEVTANLTREARASGFESVNYDLIYGLPRQTRETIERTARLTAELKPDRIALYSLARVPWIKPAQRLFRDEDLPAGAAKRELYECARDILTDAGYAEIGMDHFALPQDSLYRAQAAGQLHRNFMGYTEFRTEALLGLGVSAISESPTCFHQNEKVLPIYERRVKAGEIPSLRGHLLTPEDCRLREQILQFMTRFEVDLEDDDQARDAEVFLASLIEDGLVTVSNRKLRLTESGRPFLRNAAVFFDRRLREQQGEARIFSRAL
jgi:oxygen-independent coproporphyrinogen-3 oxidase